MTDHIIQNRARGISNFISAALLLYEKYNKHDAALSLVCSAIDATAKQLFPDDNNNERNKKFIRQYMKIITTFGFPGIIAGGIRIKCNNVQGVKIGIDGFVGIEDIIYHTIRCGLIHACEVDHRIIFTEETIIGDFDKNLFKIPKYLFWGLVMAVVLCEKNADQKTTQLSGDSIHINGTIYDLSQLWGMEQKILSYL